MESDLIQTCDCNMEIDPCRSPRIELCRLPFNEDWGGLTTGTLRLPSVRLVEHCMMLREFMARPVFVCDRPGVQPSAPYSFFRPAIDASTHNRSTAMQARDRPWLLRTALGSGYMPASIPPSSHIRRSFVSMNIYARVGHAPFSNVAGDDLKSSVERAVKTATHHA